MHSIRNPKSSKRSRTPQLPSLPADIMARMRFLKGEIALSPEEKIRLFNGTISSGCALLPVAPAPVPQATDVPDDGWIDERQAEGLAEQIFGAPCPPGWLRTKPLWVFPAKLQHRRRSPRFDRAKLRQAFETHRDEGSAELRHLAKLAEPSNRAPSPRMLRLSGIKPHEQAPSPSVVLAARAAVSLVDAIRQYLADVAASGGVASEAAIISAMKNKGFGHSRAEIRRARNEIAPGRRGRPAKIAGGGKDALP